MNYPNEYDVNYSGSSYRARTPPRYGHQAAARNLDYESGSLNSTKNDYDAESMLSSRSMAAGRDPTSRWDRRSVAAESYDNRRPSEAPPSSYSQYSRANGNSTPYHNHTSYSRGASYGGVASSEYDKPQPPHRSDHSKQCRSTTPSTFKGFTSALPGNDMGYDDLESKRSRYASHPEPDHHRSGYKTTSMYDSASGRFRHPQAPSSYRDDYPPESIRHAPSSRYSSTLDNLDSVSKRGASHEYESSWDGGSNWCDDQNRNDHSLSPKTFKKECQRAYKEARAQRMRNLEEGLYGKCDWATFDSKYC